MPAAGVKRLSIRERRFLLSHVEGHSLTECYLLLKPEADRVVAATLGSRMMRRIEKKLSWGEILEEAELGDVRLLTELEARLRATFTKHWQNISLGEFTDNAVRMRATELLADRRGRRKAEVNLHTDTIEIRLPPSPEQLARLTDEELTTLRDLTAKASAPLEGEGV
jgi:hypothetical protein